MTFVDLLEQGPGAAAEALLPGVAPTPSEESFRAGDLLGGAVNILGDIARPIVGEAAETVGSITGVDPFTGRRLSPADRVFGLAALTGVAGLGLGALAYHRVRQFGSWRNYARWQRAQMGETGALQFDPARHFTRDLPELLELNRLDEISPGRTVSGVEVGARDLPAAPYTGKIINDSLGVLNADDPLEIIDTLGRWSGKVVERDARALALVDTLGSELVRRVGVHQRAFSESADVELAKLRAAQWELAKFADLVPYLDDDLKALWVRFKHTPEQVDPGTFIDRIVQIAEDTQDSLAPGAALPAGFLLNKVGFDEFEDLHYVVLEDTESRLAGELTDNDIKRRMKRMDPRQFEDAMYRNYRRLLDQAEPGELDELRAWYPIIHRYLYDDPATLGSAPVVPHADLDAWEVEGLALARRNVDFDEAYNRMLRTYPSLRRSELHALWARRQLPRWMKNDIKADLIQFRKRNPDIDGDTFAGVISAFSPRMSWRGNLYAAMLWLDELKRGRIPPGVSTGQYTLDAVRMYGASNLNRAQRKHFEEMFAADPARPRNLVTTLDPKHGPVDPIAVLYKTQDTALMGARLQEGRTSVPAGKFGNAKRPNFYVSMRDPDNPHVWTNDVHMGDAAFGFRLPNDAQPFADPDQYSLLLYTAMANAGRRLAREYGMPPLQMQSVLWGIKKRIEDAAGGFPTLSTEIRDVVAGNLNGYDPATLFGNTAVRETVQEGAPDGQFIGDVPAGKDYPPVFYDSGPDGVRVLAPANRQTASVLRTMRPTGRNYTGDWNSQPLELWAPRRFETAGDVRDVWDHLKMARTSRGEITGNGARLWVGMREASAIDLYPGFRPGYFIQVNPLHELDAGVNVGRRGADVAREMVDEWAAQGIRVRSTNVLDPHDGLSSAWMNPDDVPQLDAQGNEIGPGDISWDPTPEQRNSWPVSDAPSERKQAMVVEFDDMESLRRAWAWLEENEGHGFGEGWFGESVFDRVAYTNGIGETPGPGAARVWEHVYSNRDGSQMLAHMSDEGDIRIPNNVPVWTSPGLHGFFEGNTHPRLRADYRPIVRQIAEDEFELGEVVIADNPQVAVELTNDARNRGILFANVDGEPARELTIYTGAEGVPPTVAFGPGGDIALKERYTLAPDQTVRAEITGDRVELEGTDWFALTEAREIVRKMGARRITYRAPEFF